MRYIVIHPNGDGSIQLPMIVGGAIHFATSFPSYPIHILLKFEIEEATEEHLRFD